MDDGSLFGGGTWGGGDPSYDTSGSTAALLASLGLDANGNPLPTGGNTGNPNLGSPFGAGTANIDPSTLSLLTALGGDGTTSGGGIDPAAIARFLTGAGAAALGNGGAGTTGNTTTTGSNGNFDLSKLLGALGLGNGSGLSSLLPLLSILAGTAGSLNQTNASKDAAQLIQSAANKSNDQATSLISGAQANFKPFIDNGAAASNAMLTKANAGPIPLPFTPTMSNLATTNKYTPSTWGLMTLKDLAKK